jgi:hypothetical protein
MLVHTDIVILTKFVTALIEHTGHLKAQFFMEFFGPGIGKYHQSVRPVHILGEFQIF